jgi:hypothetical protein
MGYFLADMAERHTRSRTCVRKRRFVSEWGANEAIKSIKDHTLVAYACKRCDGRHVGQTRANVEVPVY